MLGLQSEQVAGTSLIVERKELRDLLDNETSDWSQKAYSRLIEELSDVVAYTRGDGANFHQFDIEMIEQESEYVHVTVSIDDGGFARSFTPLTRGFIVYRDGLVEM